MRLQRGYYDLRLPGSQLVRYVRDNRERHRRRREHARAHLGDFLAWAAYRGLRLLQGGCFPNVWLLRTPVGFAQWVPGRARLLFARDLRRGRPLRYKVYDYLQLVGVLESEWLGLPGLR